MYMRWAHIQTFRRAYENNGLLLPFQFSLLYEVGGGAYEGEDSYIYSILDWRSSPGWAALTGILGVLLVTPIGHTIFSWGIYRLRVHLVHRIMKKNLNYE
jgi:hypothetical protein